MVTQFIRDGSDFCLCAEGFQVGHQFAVEVGDSEAILEVKMEMLAIAAGDQQAVLLKIEVNGKIAIAPRHGASAESATGYIEGDIPPVVSIRHQREAYFANYLRISVQGFLGIGPGGKGKCGECGGSHFGGELTAQDSASITAMFVQCPTNNGITGLKIADCVMHSVGDLIEVYIIKHRIQIALENFPVHQWQVALNR